MILVSSDLSHYHTYEQARHIDAVTTASILRREPTLAGEQACGAVGINGLLHLAGERREQDEELEAGTLDRAGADLAGETRLAPVVALGVHEVLHTGRSP